MQQIVPERKRKQKLSGKAKAKRRKIKKVLSVEEYQEKVSIINIVRLG